MNKTVKKQSKGTVAMPLINPDAAGIDVGDTLLSVAVPEGRDEQRCRNFGTFTRDLQAVAQWLHQCNITTVAMESTGVYWKPLFSVLIQSGFAVYLVNAKHTKNVTGRKSDESDAMWIQRLHSCGLLTSCFLPDDATETLRTLVRLRRTLQEDSTRYILRMQKALELMNVKIHTVINDITGKTGKAIVESIVAGKTQPADFIPLIDSRIKASKETILQSLEGNWRQEHLYSLKLCYEMYTTMQHKMMELEEQIEQVLQRYSSTVHQQEQVPAEAVATTAATDSSKGKNKRAKRKTKNQAVFDIQAYLLHIHGVDVTAIYGLSATSALEILAETGVDLSKWEKPDHFVSWLNLCPNNKISGGKLISSTRLKKKPNRAAQAFRAAANSLRRSDHWLGDFFRRMRAKAGSKYAIVATARKLAIIYYQMVRYKQPFQPLNLEVYRNKNREAKIAWHKRKLQQLEREAA
jgi:transposase